MPTTTPVLIHEAYSADYTARVHYAQRQDGQWFTRRQDRSPRFGYRWTAWRVTPCVPSSLWNTGRYARLPHAC